MTDLTNNRTDLEALAVRCEQAEAADRELDAEIAAAAGIIDDLPDFLRDPLGEPFYRVSDDGLRVEFWTHNNGKDHSLASRLPRPFTASIDAALQLVPEGWAWRVDFRPDGLDLPRGSDTEPALGMVYRGIGQGHLANAATPALALCAAALRARAGQ